MYCSSCGVAVSPGLSYCNHCGAKLNNVPSTKRPSEVRPEMLVGAMAFTFVFGLGAITVLIGVMKAGLNLEIGQILGFLVLCLFAMFALEGVFIRLLLRHGRERDDRPHAHSIQGPVTKELEGTTTPILPESMPSVTEHTTRAFDAVHVGRTSNRP